MTRRPDVAVRLGVEGGEAAKASFRELGDTGARALRQLATAAREPPPHLRAVSNTVDALERGAGGLAGRLGPLGAGLSGFGVAGLAAAAGLGAAAVALREVSNVAADYEQALDSLQTNAQLGAAGNAALAESARRLGVDYDIGATQAAGVMEELVKAGAAAQDVMDGAAASAVLLSLATGEDLQEAASIAATAMNLFSIEGAEMNRVSQAGVAFMNATQATLQDLSLGLGNVGASAAAAGLSLEDTIAVLATIVTRAGGGSDAATAFASALRALTAGTDQQKAAFEEMGVAIYDVGTGELRPVITILQEIEAAVASLTEEERNDLLMRAFGADALGKAIIPLLQRGTDEVIRFRDEQIALTDVAGMAAQRFDNQRGAQDELAASAENLSIAVGESGLTDSITFATRELANMADWLAENITQANEAAAAFRHFEEEADRAFSRANAEAWAQREFGDVQPWRPSRFPGVDRSTLGAGAAPAAPASPATPAPVDPAAAAAAAAEQARREAAAASAAAAAQRELAQARAEAGRTIDQALRQEQTPVERLTAELQALALAEQQLPDRAADVARASQSRARAYVLERAEAAGLRGEVETLLATDPLQAQALEQALAALVDGRGDLVDGSPELVQALDEEAQALIDAARAARQLADEEARFEDLRDRLTTPDERREAEREGAVGQVRAAAARGAITPQEEVELLKRVEGAFGDVGEAVDELAERQREASETFRTWSGLLRGLTGDAESAERALFSLVEQILELAVVNYEGKGGFWNAILNAGSEVLGVPSGTKGRSGGAGLMPNDNDWIGGLLRNFPGRGGGFSTGGFPRPGFTYGAAEGGRPELFVLGGGGQVYSAEATVDLLTRSLARQPGGDGGGVQRLALTIRDETDGRVDAQATNGPEGPGLDLTVRQVLRRQFAAGEYDGVFRQRYGVRPAGQF